MYRDRPSKVLIRGLQAALAAVAAFGLRAAHPLPLPATASAPADEECSGLPGQLAAAKKALNDRGPALQQRVEAIAKALQDLKAPPESTPASELAGRKEKLIAERAAVQKELRYLESAGTTWQAALDACESAMRFRQELEQFRADQRRKRVEFVSADVDAFQSQLDQIQNARSALDEGEAVRGERLAGLTEQIGKADEQARPPLVAEQAALLAETGATRHKRVALDAERALLEAKLAAAQEALGPSTTTQATATSTAPAKEAKADADNKQLLARQLEAEARDRLGHARARLQEIQGQLSQARDAGLDTARLEDNREYWQRKETFELRRLEQADLHQRAAREKQEIAQLIERRQAVNNSLEQLRQTRWEMSPDERQKQADRFRAQADAGRERAGKLEQRAAAEDGKIEPIQKRLPGFDAIEQALWQRLQEAPTFADSERLAGHYRRMKEQLNTERQQIDLMIMTMENVVFAIKRQASLEYELADLYTQCAEVLVPSEPSFWQRNESIITSIMILGVVVAISYGVKLAVWFIQRLIAHLDATVGDGRFSVKRAGTLLSFAGSIVKLFVWIFGVVWVLNEFGISPATTSGALGLIGLIMAGMFQQIVVDFVKGLDIIAGRHYNVGDFVEVDGKFGHVVDFNVKYTRIRTGSGQEFNVPNSQCLPSRRFPDGYVDNYVDLTLKSCSDEDAVKNALGAVCQDLNHRIEPIRDEPVPVRQFVGPQGRVTLRYRVRVLPGSDWVVKDYFIPAVKETLAGLGVELAAEPTFFFINRIQTFRKLFSRQLSEEEIVRQTGESDQGPATDEDIAQPATPGANVAASPGTQA